MKGSEQKAKKLIKQMEKEGEREAKFIERSMYGEFEKHGEVLKDAANTIKKFMKKIPQARDPRGTKSRGPKSRVTKSSGTKSRGPKSRATKSRGTKSRGTKSHAMHQFFTVAKKLIKPPTETVKNLIETSFDDLYKSLDPTKPVVFIITTHGSRPRTNDKLLKKLKLYMNSIIVKFKDTTNDLLQFFRFREYFKNPHDEEEIEVSYIKAYLDGIYQILAPVEVERLQGLLIEEMCKYHTEAREFSDNIDGGIPKEYIDNIAKKLKEVQFGRDTLHDYKTPDEWRQRRKELMKELKFDHDDFYLSLMALNEVCGVNRWETIQQQYKPGDPIHDSVNKILSQQSYRDTEVKDTDWSVRLVGGPGTIGVPYLFSPFGDLIDIGAFTINGNRLLSIESLHLLGSKIIKKRKQDYPNGLVQEGVMRSPACDSVYSGDNPLPINTTMMIVDFSCGSWRKPVPYSYARAPRLFVGEVPFPSSQQGCVIAGGGTKSKKKKNHKSKKFKNNKKRSNKKINRRKYTRKK